MAVSHSGVQVHLFVYIYADDVIVSIHAAMNTAAVPLSQCDEHNYLRQYLHFWHTGKYHRSLELLSS